VFGGGLFLQWNSTKEIRQLLEGEKCEASTAVRTTAARVHGL
jgi:hypothetical protein